MVAHVRVRVLAPGLAHCRTTEFISSFGTCQAHPGHAPCKVWGRRVGLTSTRLSFPQLQRSSRRASTGVQGTASSGGFLRASGASSCVRTDSAMRASTTRSRFRCRESIRTCLRAAVHGELSGSWPRNTCPCVLQMDARRTASWRAGRGRVHPKRVPPVVRSATSSVCVRRQPCTVV